MSEETKAHAPKQIRVAGVLAMYETPADAVHAAEKVRDAGYTKWDVNTPFPVHGMDGAMGLRPTIMGWISLGGGLTGGSLALLLQWWTNGVDYPLNIGGKPAFAIQAFIPITFELTILLCAFATLFGMLGLNRLPQLYHWAFGSKNFERATDDRFFITIEADDPKFDAEKTKSLLEKTHPAAVEVIEETLTVHEASRLRANVGLTVEALAGISSPFEKKESPRTEPETPAAKISEPPPAKAKSEPPPAKAKSEPPPAAETKAEETKAEETKPEETKAEETKSEETKSDDEKKDEGEK